MKMFVFCIAALLALTSAQPVLAEGKQLFPPNGGAACEDGKYAVIGWEKSTGLTCVNITQDSNDNVVLGKPLANGSYTGNTYPAGGLVLPQFGGNPPSILNGSIWIDTTVVTP